jgi:hypothetical protein
MGKKIIAWVDPQGRYRNTSFAYKGLMEQFGFATEDEAMEWGWAETLRKRGLAADYPHFILDSDDQATRLTEIQGTYFRYGVFMKRDYEERYNDDGSEMFTRDARDGAWEIDTDGRPKINMAKARGVQMDKIRVVRNKELAQEDTNMLKALEAGDTSAQSAVNAKKQTLRDIPQTFDLTTDNDTPAELKVKWPTELPAQE